MTLSVSDIFAKQGVKIEEGDLRQYGIMGMKWGKRRPRGKDGLVSGRAVAKIDKNIKLQKSPTPKGNAKDRRREGRTDFGSSRPISKISSAELKDRLARAELEKRYQDLVKLPAHQPGPARAFIGQVLLASGKTVATAYATKYLDVAVSKALNTDALTAYNKAKKKK